MEINKKDKLEVLFHEHLFKNDFTDIDIDLLIDIVDVFRPRSKKNIRDFTDISCLITILEDNDHYRIFFQKYLTIIFYKKDYDQIVTDAGIINYDYFFYEIKKRLVEKVIPYQPSKHTLQFILNQVFYSSNDPLWLEKIPFDQLENLFDVCGFKGIYRTEGENFELSKLLYSLEVLVQRISGRALETEVSKMVPENQNLDSPFIAIQMEFSDLNNTLIKSKQKYISSENLSYKQLLVLHKQCLNYVNTAFKNSHKYGISINVNQSLLRIRQQLERLEEMLKYLVLDDQYLDKRKTINFSLKLIRYNCHKNNIRNLVDDSTQLISYEITQHTAQTGEHYITKDLKGYWKMFKSAVGGGIIVGFLCIIKLLFSKIDTSEFGDAVLYSLNYSFGFILIYLLGCTLATKQPSMTASALASALEQGRKNKSDIAKYYNFAIFFSQVFRSQFIAFVGNVIAAFPVALLLVWIMDKLMGFNIAESKWHTLMNDLDPIKTPAIFHAAIAGFFLFISGVIAGSVANRDKHNRVYYRIEEHPILKKIFGKDKTKKIAKTYEKKWAGIISNFWFGIFLGSTASVGLFLGLNLDIRHITFASGNLALGLYGGNFNISFWMIAWGIFGIGIIGLVNFLVSFSLSLILAFRSRKISLLEFRLVGYAIWEFFRYKPQNFFFPPKEDDFQPLSEKE